MTLYLGPYWNTRIGGIWKMKIYIEIDGNNSVTSWSSSPFSTKEIELDIDDAHSFIIENPFIYQYIDGQLVKNDSMLLEKIKARKNAELKQACESAILAGFISSNGHTYRTNRDDQTNMIGQKDKILADSTISIVQWKTEDVGYVSHTRDEWLTVYNEAFDHKQQQLFKYDSIKGQVNACTTYEAIQAIVW